MENYIKFIDEKIDKKIIPGIIFGVFDKNNDCIVEHIYGYTDKNEKQKVQKNSMFRLASMTKPITGVACLICQDMGLLSIYDKISKYLPEFKDMNVGRIEDGKVVFDHKAKREITILDILTHGSGLGSGQVGDNQLCKFGKMKNKDEQIEIYSKMYLDFDPGEKALYGALIALDIVTKIIEIVSGENYYSFIKKHILDPLEMIDTTYKLNDEQKKRVVTVYNLNNEDGLSSTELKLDSGFENMENGYQSGCAGLYSTFNDYKNFAYMLLCNGVYKGKRILSEKAMELIQTPQHKIPKEGLDENNNWGAGAMHVRGPHHILDKGSFGWSGAYATHFFINPKKQIYAVLLDSLNNNVPDKGISNELFEKAVMNMYNK